MNKKLWGGRFSINTNPTVDAFNASIDFDVELVREDILGSLAHAAMLQRCGIISADEHTQLQRGLREIAQNVIDDEITFHINDEDIHMNIERLLHERIGEAAGKLHTARSRNDQVSLDVHLYVRKQVVTIVSLLSQLQATLVNMAKRDRDVIVPGYTHMQRAMPVYLASHWLAYVAMLQRDVERLKDSWQRINQSPLGAAALAGSSFPIDKHYVASQLGFDGIYVNTMDAVSDRDFVIEFLANASFVMMHLSRLSEELVLWSSQEFNFVSFDEGFCTGSSIMPQKKNPDVVELGRGKTGRVYGALFSLLTLMKGLPLAYNKDLQEDKEPLFDTVKTLRTTLSVYIPMLATLKINAANMLSGTVDGFLNATALAEYLVKKGLAFRVAHEIVGKIVAHCCDKACKIEDLSINEMQQFSKNIDETVYPVLAVENIVAIHDAGNFAKSSLLATEFATREKQMTETKQWLSERENLFEKIVTQFNLPVGF